MFWKCLKNVMIVFSIFEGLFRDNTKMEQVGWRTIYMKINSFINKQKKFNDAKAECYSEAMENLLRKQRLLMLDLSRVFYVLKKMVHSFLDGDERFINEIEWARLHSLHIFSKACKLVFEIDICPVSVYHEAHLGLLASMFDGKANSCNVSEIKLQQDDFIFCDDVKDVCTCDDDDDASVNCGEIFPKFHKLNADGKKSIIETLRFFVFLRTCILSAISETFQDVKNLCCNSNDDVFLEEKRIYVLNYFASVFRLFHPFSDFTFGEIMLNEDAFYDRWCNACPGTNKHFFDYLSDMQYNTMIQTLM